MDKLERLKEAKEKAELLKTKVMPVVLGTSIALSSGAVVGCSKDPNAPKQTKTAVVVNGDTAMLVEVAYFYSEPISKTSDKVEYTLHLHHGQYGDSSAYIQVYDDEKTDVVVIDDFDSFEKAETLAYTRVGKDGSIYLYGDEGIVNITVEEPEKATDKSNTNTYKK